MPFKTNFAACGGPASVSLICTDISLLLGSGSLTRSHRTTDWAAWGHFVTWFSCNIEKPAFIPDTALIHSSALSQTGMPANRKGTAHVPPPHPKNVSLLHYILLYLVRFSGLPLQCYTNTLIVRKWLHLWRDPHTTSSPLLQEAQNHLCNPTGIWQWQGCPRNLEPSHSCWEAATSLSVAGFVYFPP